VAFRETYHSIMNDDLAGKTLRGKGMKGDAHKMISRLEELGEIWDTLDTCYERPEKYMEEALKPILEFRKYRVFDNIAIREFYSILRAAIKGAKGICRLDLLVNDQTVPKIMGKMPFSDWATKRPEWVRGDLGLAFEGFMERSGRTRSTWLLLSHKPGNRKGPRGTGALRTGRPVPEQQERKLPRDRRELSRQWVLLTWSPSSFHGDRRSVGFRDRLAVRETTWFSVAGSSVSWA
jgi:hypothetical protein